MIVEENYTELYKRFKDLQKVLVNDILAKIVAEFGKKDEEDYCGLFLPVPGGLTLSYFLGESSGRSALEVAYICLLNDEVSVTGRLKSERITFQDGMFDPGAFYTDGTFGSPAIIDLKDLCEIADAVISEYWGFQSGPIYNNYIDLHRDIYKSIVHYCETSQDAYSYMHRSRSVSLHWAGSAQVCVDKGVDLYLDTIEMDAENVVVTCAPDSYGYQYFLLILTPDMKDPCIAKFYKKDGNGNTAPAIIKTTDLLRILRATALYSRNGLWPGISPLNEHDDAKDLLGDTSCEHNEELVKELSELISKNGSKETFLCGMTGVSIRHEGQLVGFEDSRLDRLPYSYSFSIIASDVDGAICFFDDCDHLVLRCDGYSSCQNSSLDDHLTYEDHQYVTIPDWQLRELCDSVRRKFEAD